MELACRCEVSADALINIAICCPAADVLLWSVSEGFPTPSLLWRSGPGETLDSDRERVTTDRQPVWLTGTRDDGDEDEGCWLLLWLMREKLY